MLKVGLVPLRAHTENLRRYIGKVFDHIAFSLPKSRLVNNTLNATKLNNCTCETNQYQVSQSFAIPIRGRACVCLEN